MAKKVGPTPAELGETVGHMEGMRDLPDPLTEDKQRERARVAANELGLTHELDIVEFEDAWIEAYQASISG